jgi:hypothetical protein
MSPEGDTELGKGKRGDDASYTDINFTGLKNKENLHD